VLPTTVIDHTASQGAVTYDRESRLLYVVNAGSNTVSVFDVNGARLHLTQVVASGGTFPVSIAVRHGVAFVVNAQDGGSVQGYLVIGRRLVPIGAWHRALGLDPTLTKFTQTPGQVAFSPDGRHLLVTTKANTNSIDVFRLNGIDGIVGPVVHSVRAGAVPFALDFTADGTVLVVDAGTAAVTSLALHSDGTLTLVSSVPTGHEGNLLGDPRRQVPPHHQPRRPVRVDTGAQRECRSDGPVGNAHRSGHRRSGDQPRRPVPLRRDRRQGHRRRVPGGA
jgi:6-phosphogluconolactonase (cycloisomerase 2 family)